MHNAHRWFIRFRSTSNQRVRGLVVVAAFLAAACGGDGYGSGGPTAPVDPGTSPVPAATVQATPAERFTPQSVVLAIGGTATFEFGSLGHNVFFDNAPAGAPANITAVTTNQSVARTFTTAGTYIYNCHVHPGMTGTVFVR
jgi:plastocyanin